MRAPLVTLAPLFVLLICGCGGGGAAGPATSSASPVYVLVSVSIAVPASSTNSTARRPSYISSATRSVAITVNNGTPTIAACQIQTGSVARQPQSGGGNCVTQVPAPVGSDLFTMTAYDATGGTGNILSIGSLMQTITIDQTNSVVVTLNGVVASMFLGTNPGSVTAGSACSTNCPDIQLQVVDADGQTITSPGVYVNSSGTPISITLTDSDTTGATMLASNTVASPSNSGVNFIGISYNGNGICSPTFTASAPGITSKSAALIVKSNSTSNGRVYVSVQNFSTRAVLVYPVPLTNSSTPCLTLAQTYGPWGIGFDSFNEIYLSFQAGNPSDVLEYAQPANLSTPNNTYTGLTDPEGIWLDASNDLWVADPGAAAVKEYTYGGSVTTPAVTISSGLSDPVSVAFDSGGRLYVADATNNAVKIYTPTFTNASTPNVTITNGLNSPQGVALSGSLLCVSNFIGANVTCYTSPFGNASTPSITLTRPGQGQAFAPRGIAFDGSGNLYVLDNNNAQLLEYASGFSTGSSPSVVVSVPAGIEQVTLGP